MILGALAMIVANAATVLGARRLLDLIKVGKPSTDFVLFLLLRLLLISGTVVLAGATRTLTATGLGLAGAVALAILLALGAHRGFPRPARPPWEPWLLVVAGFVALRLLLQVWFFAPSMGDALAYHLPKVAEWVQAGALTRELGPDPRSTFPAGFELVETWWVVFLHHDVLIEMAGVEFLVLAGAGAYALAREMGWSERAASLAALLFTLTPGLHLQATACVNDAPVAALVVATTALIVARAHPLLIAIPAGLAIGIKPVFVYACPGLAVIAWLFRREAGTTPASLRAAAALCAGALLVGAVWYLRNWVLYGNPIHPVGSEGMKSQVTGLVLQRMGPSFRALRENLMALLDVRIYDRVAPADPLFFGNANWGAAAFGLGAPALIALLRTEPGLRRISIGLLVSMLSVFLLVEMDPWSLRFALFFPVLPALALARLWECHRFVAYLGAPALAGLLLATFVPGTVPAASLTRIMRENWRERALYPLPEAPVDGGRVAYCSDGFGTAYSLYGPSLSRRVVYLREDTLEALLARLRRENIDRFYVTGGARNIFALLEEGISRRKLRLVRQDPWSCYIVCPGP